MITGAHIIVYSKDSDADRVFFRDVLKFHSVDAGQNWLIFALPPAEVAFHPSKHNDLHELYFMCDDLKATMQSLQENHVKCGAVREERWGTLTTISLPGGGKIGLYQPKHPSAIQIVPQRTTRTKTGPTTASSKTYAAANGPSAGSTAIPSPAITMENSPRAMRVKPARKAAR